MNSNPLVDIISIGGLLLNTSQFELKAWGRTLEVISNPFYSQHHLEVIAGGYCSLHYHRRRANRFIVQSGQVEIIEMFGPFVKRTRLGSGSTHDVPSLVTHMFVVYQSGIMLEEYYPDRGGEVRTDDIIRLVEGGILTIDKLDDLPGCLFDLTGKLREI